MAGILGKALDGYVQNQIGVRQKTHGSGTLGTSRTSDQITYLNSNTSWIKLASGVKIDDPTVLTQAGLPSSLTGVALAKGNILFGGTSKYSSGKLTHRQGLDSYEFSEFGFVPMMGITELSVKCLNRGSLKKAKLKINIQSKRQFEIFSILYLRLGYTVMVEWGNSFYLDNSLQLHHVRDTVIENDFFVNSSNQNYLPIIKTKIPYYRKIYHANYDGLLGAVSNFNWEFKEDGSYEVNLEILSLGDIIESTKSNVDADKELVKFLQQAEQFDPNYQRYDLDSSVISSILSLWKFFDIQNKSATRDKLTITLTDGKVVEVGDFVPNDMGTVVTGSTSPVSGTLAFTPTEETWKFEFFEPYGGGSGKLDLTGVNEMDSGFFAGNHYPKGSQPANPVTKAFKGFPGNSTTNTPDTEDPTVQAKKFLLDIYTQHYSKPPATLPDIILAPGSTADKYYVKVGDYTYKPEETMTLGGQVDEAYAAVMTLVTRVTGSASSGAVPPPPTSSPPPTAKNPLVNEPKNTVVKIASSNPQYYMRLGYLLEYMKNKIVPVHQNSKEPILNIAYEKDASMMYCFPISISVNPTICIVKNKTFTKLNNKQAQVFNELEDWKSTDNKAHPANIYLNFDFIISCLTSTTDERGDTNIYGFIQELCVGINKALGGVNNLEAVVEESSNTIRLVDTTPIPKEISSDISPIIELFGYDASQKNSNFVRNIQLKTAITPEFASTATVGATAKGYVKGSEGVAFSKLNEGLTDRFNPELVPPSPNTQPNEAQTNYENDFLKWVSLCYGMDGDLSSVPPVVGKISDSVIKKNVSIVTEYYKYLLATQTNNQSGTIGFIPFKLSYTTDGISGINIYDKLTIDTRFFPYEYGAALDFIVTGVSHTLKGNDWETGIETTVIGKSKAVTVPTRAGVEVTNAATQEPYIPSPTSPSPVTPSGPLKAGDLYTWVKGGNSTVPDFPDGYAADVLKYNVPNNLIPIPVTPLTKTFEGWKTRRRSDGTVIRVWCTQYKTTKLSLAATEDFYKKVLAKIGAPVTLGNMIFLKAWRQAEGANATYNPFNSSQIKNNIESSFNTFKVQNYFSLNDGIDATVTTMTNGKYPNIIKAFRKGIPDQVNGKKLANLLQRKATFNQSAVDALINSW